MLSHSEALASRRSISETLLKTNDEDGVESAIRQYHSLRDSQPNTYDFSEGELHRLGYQLLNAKKIEAGIEILKLNVQAYPNSHNTYDSLGEGYMANGQKELAIQNYKRSLELNPKNTNAAEILNKLGASSFD